MDMDIDSDQRNWAMACHLGAMAGFIVPFGHILGPLGFWAWKKEGRPFVDLHGKEAVNFQIAMTCYILAASVLTVLGIGFLLLAIFSVWTLAAMVMAAVKAKNGEEYRYRFIFRFVK